MPATIFNSVLATYFTKQQWQRKNARTIPLRSNVCLLYCVSNPADKKDKKRATEKIKRERQNISLAHASRRNPAKLEAQIASLKQIDAQGRLSDADRAVLLTLEKELRVVKRAKAQFGEQTGPVIVSDRTKGDEALKAKLREKEEKKQFREILKRKVDPRRSVYYDEVWNPYGVPPPGMPWKERDEEDSEGTRPTPYA
jgi:mRNA biogenesis factor/WW domain binding protein 11